MAQLTTPTVAVSLSHDGTSWTDVTSHVSIPAGGIRFARGRSQQLAEWQPGTIQVAFANNARAVDPTNDDAVFQLRPGDRVKVALNGTTAFRGKIDTYGVAFTKSGATPTSTLRTAGSDGLADLGRATVIAPGAGTGTGFTAPFLTGTNVDTVLALSQLDYTDTATTDDGDVATVLPFDGEFNALELIQTLTRTEGGNSQLFTLKDGTLRWRSRYAKASQVVQLGGSGIPIFATDIRGGENDWANQVNITPAEHVTLEESTTSMAPATGSKSFTLTSPLQGDAVGFSAGDAVYVESRGSTGNNMTGTVTSYDEATRALVVNVTSKNGSTTRTDWNLEFTMAATRQTGTDAQSRTRYDAYRSADLSTYHRSLAAAEAEAIIIAATRAHPRRRFARVTVELAGLTAAQQTSILGLEIGDAVGVTLALGTGSPSLLYQARMIDGIEHVVPGNGSHQVTFTLGPEVTLDFSVVVKQNNSTVTSTTNEAVYSARDGWVDAHGHISITAAGTTNTEIKLTPTGLPSPATANAGDTVGTFKYVDAGTGNYIGSVVWDGTDLKLYRANSSSVNPIGQDPNFATANGDGIRFQLHYRQA